MSEKFIPPSPIEITPIDAVDFAQTPEKVVDAKRRALLGESAVETLKRTGELVGVVVKEDNEGNKIPLRYVNLGEDFGTEIIQGESSGIGAQLPPVAESLKPQHPPTSEQPAEASPYPYTEITPSEPKSFADLEEEARKLGIPVDEEGVSKNVSPEPTRQTKKPKQVPDDEEDEPPFDETNWLRK